MADAAEEAQRSPWEIVLKLVEIYFERDRPLTHIEIKALHLLTGASQKSWQEAEEKYRSRKNALRPVLAVRKRNM